MEPIRQITGMVLKIAFCLGIFLILLCSLFPDAILGFFTSDTAILSEAGSLFADYKVYISFVSCDTGASVCAS